MAQNSVTELPFISRYRKCFDATWSDDTAIDQVRFVVLDTETTGLNPRTDRIITLMKAQAKARFGDESRHQELMGHVIEPEQVADMVCFLASARASQLSGVVYNLGA